MTLPAPDGLPPKSDDQTAIRASIDRWTAAAHDGDLATVVADRADDIVLFDVPSPHDGVRGIDAYPRRVARVPLLAGGGR